MPQPFQINPILSDFPANSWLDVHQLSAAVGTSRVVREAIVRLWLTEGVPAAFGANPGAWEALRVFVAARMGACPKDVTLVGSARLGFSLRPPPRFGSRFTEFSDLDLALVSTKVFDMFERTFREFATDYASAVVVPRSAIERSYWDANIKEGPGKILRGFLDAHMIPSHSRYAIAKQASEAMWTTKARLDATRQAPRVKRASVRVYRTWRDLVRQVSLSLSLACPTTAAS